ncbi:protein of unknown function [Paraburkholderia dioscoreae]|uniref:Uncharacterized protein n=1 Tax=Paraburkholderia dioscoreae TaxID=2604047 RepID=A0A5Q4ZBF6_9BURK|nr:protein of unknown function [Paraburkholderia dioscoreae]
MFRPVANPGKSLFSPDRNPIVVDELVGNVYPNARLRVSILESAGRDIKPAPMLLKQRDAFLEFRLFLLKATHGPGCHTVPGCHRKRACQQRRNALPQQLRR